MEKPSLDTAKAGAMRFNTNSSQLEIYDGNQWTGILATSPEQILGGTRMLFMGGTDGSSTVDVIQYVNIATTGDAADFGDLTSARRDVDAASSPTRAVFVGGDTPTLVNTMDYVEILTTGNALDFGDQTTKRDRLSACSNGHGGL